MRFTIAPYCAAISPAACVPAMPSAWTVLSASSFRPRAAPAPAEKTPSVAPECQPCPMCSCPIGDALRRARTRANRGRGASSARALRAGSLRTGARRRIRRRRACEGWSSWSFQTDLRFPDQFAEALLFRADVGGELLRGAADRLRALREEARPHLGLLKRFHELGVESRDDFARRPRRREHAVPRTRFVAG